MFLRYGPDVIINDPLSSNDVIINDPLSSNLDKLNAYAMRGDAHAQKGLFEEACKDYTNALALVDKCPINAAPIIVSYLGSRGFTYYKQGKFEEAIADYSTQLDFVNYLIDPSSSEYPIIIPAIRAAYANRALVYHIQGKGEQALKDLYSYLFFFHVGSEFTLQQKQNLLISIKRLPDQLINFVLEQALNKQTLLGQIFWKKSHLFEKPSLTNGILKEIVDELEKNGRDVSKYRVNQTIKIGPMIFTDTNAARIDNKENPSSAVTMHKSL